MRYFVMVVGEEYHYQDFATCSRMFKKFGVTPFTYHLSSSAAIKFFENALERKAFQTRPQEGFPKVYVVEALGRKFRVLWAGARPRQRHLEKADKLRKEVHNATA